MGSNQTLARADTIYARRESGVRSYCRHYAMEFDTASGSVARDTAGREYIDFLAGAGALNYGHNDPDMADALVAHIRRGGLAHGLDLHTSVKGGFLATFERLVLAPREMDHRVQFTGPTGTNAVEAALKLARKVTGRRNVIAFTNGFHGVSAGSLAATGNRHHRLGGALSLPDVTRLPYDGYLSGLDSAELLERLLADGSSGVDAPAAVLVETVQGEGGLSTASSEWLRDIASVARSNGAALIVDDVQAGCGRTGDFLSTDALDVVPDMVVLSKSISGFGLPMALLVVAPEWDRWKPGEHNGTFRGNAHAFVTAQVALEKFWSDGGLVVDVARRSALIRERLERIAATVPGAQVKGRGMMQGVDVRDGDLAAQVCRRAGEAGLLVETSGPADEVVKVLAPLTTPDDLLVRGLGILEEAAVTGVGSPVTL